MSRPLAIDLFCGLFGWGVGLAAEGFEVVGFDLEDMGRQFGQTRPAHCQLVLQDVLTLHGRQFRDAALIVASPPCQKYSWMAQPWKRARAAAAEIRADETGQMLADLNRLFDTCFRIQAQASFAAGRHIPLVVENVRGAQPWVGRARWNFGSFYLWGDVPALMPFTSHQPLLKPQPYQRRHGTGSVPSFRFDGSRRSFQMASVKVNTVGGRWFNDGPRTPDSLSSSSSRSPARKMASAMIAKIPEPLARHIAAVYRTA